MVAAVNYRSCRYDPQAPGLEEAKQTHREMVLEHFASVHRPGTPNLRYFGLPGVRWAFERQVLKQYPFSTVVGVERDPVVAVESWVEMQNAASDELIRFDRDPFSLHVSSARDYLLENRGQGFDMAWLDTTGSCREELMDTMQGLACNISKKPVPFAVTFTLGRERPEDMPRLHAIGGNKTPTEQRVHSIRVALIAGDRRREVSISRCHRYKSVNDMRMVLLLGVVHAAPIPLNLRRVESG